MQKLDYRWLCIALAFVGIVINYLDRSALAYAITPIEHLFHLNDADFGLIGSAFATGYMIMSPIGGFLVDRFGARITWCVSAILWSLSCAAMGLATSFGAFIILRMLLGVTEAGTFPSLNRLVADNLPVQHRAKALGLGIAAVPLSLALGSPLLAYLVTALSYQQMFFILGGVGVLWGILWFYLFPKMTQPITVKEKNTATQHKKINWKLLFTPSLLANNFAYFAFGYIVFFAMTWLPGFLEKTYSLKLAKVGWLLTLPWLTAAIFVILGGVISDHIWAKTQRIRLARSYLILSSLLISALSFIVVVYANSLTVAAIGLSLGVGFAFMPNAAFYAVNTDLVPEQAATSLGIMLSFFGVGGIVAPALTGWLTVLTGHFNTAIYLMVGFILLAVLAIGIFQRPAEGNLIRG